MSSLIWYGLKIPLFLFLAETMIDEARLDQVLDKINFDQKWEVLRNGRGGDLVLYWKNSVNIIVEDLHKYFIDTTIDKGMDSEWRFTGFYGEPETARRHKAWSKLRVLNRRASSPWLYVGNFNKIVKQNENLGRAVRNHNQMQLFRDIIDECGILDWGFAGPDFTWSKHFDDGT